MSLLGARGRWYVLAALWAALLVIGIGGFLQQARDGGFERSNLDTLYLMVQLATLNYEGGDDSLNWRLEIARFVAPLMAAGTVIQTASYVFRDQFERFRLRFARGHTIVCGLGPAGTRLAVAQASAGRRVVAIEPDANAPGAATAREHDVTVIVGDPTDEALLRAARVATAARLVAVSESDAVNVEVASVARACVAGSRGRHGALRCAVHLTDAELVTLLRAGDLDAHGDARVGFFNLHERAARALVAEHPPFTLDPDATDVGEPHVVIIGLGQLGRSLVVAIAQRWVQQRDGRSPLRLTLVDRVAGGRWQALVLQHPALGEVCTVAALDLDLDAPAADAVDAFTSAIEQGRPTWVAVALEDESLALSTALFVHQRLARRSVPLVVRTGSATGMSAVLVPGPDRASPFPGMAVFPFLDRACTVDAVDGGTREQLAEAVHEDYLAQLPSGAVGAMRRRWDELTDGERELSRRRVDGILTDLASIGRELVPLRRWGASALELEPAAVEQLARQEHERWRADRMAGGWAHGPVRDDATKRNPLLVPWDELPADARAMNLASARALPDLLARAGFDAQVR